MAFLYFGAITQLQLYRHCNYRPIACSKLSWKLIQNHLPLYAESENLFMYRNDHQIYMTADSIKKDVQERMSETEMVTQWYKVTLCLTL